LWGSCLICKKYKSQTILIVSGFVLMYTVVILDCDRVLALKANTGSILFAETAGLDSAIYWTNYQDPIVIVDFFVVGALFFFFQRHLD